jgi:hypothetical protein
MWSQIACNKVAEHEMHFFFELDGIPLSGPQITLGDLSAPAPDWIPADQFAALAGRYRNESIWTKTTDRAGSDFYAHLQDIVAGRRKELATLWCLTAPAKAFLENADLYEHDVPRTDRVRKQIVLALADKETHRFAEHGAEARALSIVLDSAMLHVFASGISFAHLIVRAQPLRRGDLLSALELVETQTALARIHGLYWQSVDCGQPLAKFNLHTLVRQLTIGARAEVRKEERIRTYTYARFSNYVKPAELDFLGFYLARHYTSDYLLDATVTGIERVGQFETVRHTIAMEGSATLISPEASGKLPKYLANFSGNTLRAHYVPIMLLALHEYAFLVDRTSQSVMDYRGASDAHKTLRVLGRLRSDSLVFRVCFRFSQVSHITMHNLVNLAFRRAYGLDRMMGELATDVAEIEGFLRTVQEQNIANRFYWFSVIGGASLAGFAGVSIFSAIFRVMLSYQFVQDSLLKILNGRVTREWLTAGHSSEIAHAPETFGLAMGGIVFLIACWLISRHRPLPQIRMGRELTIHDLLEQLSKTFSRD